MTPLRILLGVARGLLFITALLEPRPASEIVVVIWIIGYVFIVAKCDGLAFEEGFDKAASIFRKRLGLPPPKDD